MKKEVKTKTMKKILSIFILLIMVAAGCSSPKKVVATQEKQGAGMEFDYTAVTRGYYRKVIITPAGIVVMKDQDSTAVLQPVSAADWNSLVLPYNDNVSNKGARFFEDMTMPSNKYRFDGALAATLTIKANGQLYTTPTFDHGNPPAEVKSIVEKMIQLGGIETK